MVLKELEKNIQKEKLIAEMMLVVLYDQYGFDIDGFNKDGYVIYGFNKEK